MIRMVFHHLRGARATECDVISLGSHRELILGRAQSAAVRFHPSADQLVGRHHARIVPDQTAPGRFVLSDLESRNGTFLNGNRVVEPTVMRSGDVVQLGEEGPTVRVHLDMGDTGGRIATTAELGNLFDYHSSDRSGNNYADPEHQHGSDYHETNDQPPPEPRSA